MSSSVLVVYHTVEGQTARIARRIADRLEEAGDEAVFAPVSAAPSPESFDVVVVGDSIHAVHHSRQLRRYLRENARALAAKPCALFQVSLTSANPDDAHTATANAMVEELLDETAYSPELIGTFAGALQYTRYGWIKRRIMRSIVRREGGDTDMTRDYEYTNWDAVDRFADDVHVLARSGARSSAGGSER
jgi:menaquinone-dependent protoporphyrinogen oxidase